MIRVLIADDHKLVRAGIRSVLTLMATDIEITGEACSGREVIHLLNSQAADVVLMDIDMPEGNGIETTRKVSELFPQTKVLILTMVDNELYVKESLKAGAQGYVLKSAGRKELLHAIRAVAEGEEYFSADLTKLLLNKESHRDLAATGMGSSAGNQQAMVVSLSAREMEVLRLIGQGYTNQQIADITFTSKRTIETHRQNLLEKTGSNNTATLIRYAATHGLLS